LLGSRSSLCACAVRDRSRSSRGGKRKTGTVPRDGRQYSTLDILHLISRLLVIINPGPTCVSPDDVWTGHGTLKTQNHPLNPKASQIPLRIPSVHHYHSVQLLEVIRRSPIQSVTIDEIRTTVVLVGWNLHPLLTIRSFIQMKVTLVPVERADLSYWGQGHSFISLGFHLSCTCSYL